MHGYGVPLVEDARTYIHTLGLLWHSHWWRYKQGTYPQGGFGLCRVFGFVQSNVPDSVLFLCSCQGTAAHCGILLGPGGWTSLVTVSSAASALFQEVLILFARQFTW